MYSALLLGLINRIVGDQHRSEKILQAAFLRYWQEIRLFNPARERLFTWMTGIARQLAVEAVKSATPAQQKNRSAVKLVYVDENANFAASGNGESTEEISPLDLVCFKGYTLQKAAGECGMDVEELKQKLRTELKLLRDVKVNE
ncbi:MAG: sigma factor [Bacteroidia bacterium]